MDEFSFLDVPKGIQVSGDFSEDCRLSVSSASGEALVSGALRVNVRQLGRRQKICRAHISLSAVAGTITLNMGSDDASVVFEAGTSGLFELSLYRDAEVRVGANTTSNGVLIVCDRSSVVTGRDCMFSDNVLIQAADQHGIVDLQTGEIENNKPRSVTIGDHVWLGRHCAVMPDVVIGQGAIVGLGALVVNSVPEFSAVVGVPARTVRSPVTWTRYVAHLDEMSKAYVHAWSGRV